MLRYRGHGQWHFIFRKEEMLKLNYIIIGDLPQKEICYLKRNLRTDDAEGKGVSIAGGKWTKERLRRFPAEESILISGESEELTAAQELGFATIGYAPYTDNDRVDLYAEGFEEIGLTLIQHTYERCHGIPWTISETKRCVVKEFSMEYLDELFELYAGEGMTDYIEPLYPYEQEKEYQQAYIRCMYGFYGYGMWIVCEKGTGKLIGRAGIEYREELGGKPELGYLIGVPYQRKGYATEICRAILAYAKEELEMTEILCLIEEGNRVSEHIAETLGFSFEQVMDVGGKKMRKYVLILD